MTPAAGAVAHQVWDLISAVPFVIGDGQLRLTASIGVAKISDCGSACAFAARLRLIFFLSRTRNTSR